MVHAVTGTVGASDGQTPEAAMNRWKAWDEFVSSTPQAGFMQTSSWADFRLTLGYQHFGAIVSNRGRILGGAIVQKCWYAPDQCFYYLQDGPVLPVDKPRAAEIFEVIVEEIDRKRIHEEGTVSHLRIEPRWESLPEFVIGFQAPSLNDSFMEPRRTLCVDLRPSETEILAQMKPKGRYSIRVAQRHGVSVVEDTSERGIADFLTIYEATTERQRIDSKSCDYFAVLASLLGEQNKLSMFFAEYQGVRLAGAVVVYCGARATYFFGGSLETFRNVMAPYVLHFEIMRRAKARGLEEYDLWGVAPENAPDDPWQNISIFKRKLGGREVELVPALDYVYDRSAYDQFVVIEAREDECDDNES